MSFSYQTTTISELMSELDTLGGSSRVKMKPSYLTALTQNNIRINHYSSQKDYITWENQKKKYYYDQVLEQYNKQLISIPKQYYDDGFNVTILVYGNLFEEILKSIYEQRKYAINHYLYPMQPTQPVISLLQDQSKTRSNYYEWDKHIKIQSNKNEVTLTKIVSKINSCSELRILSLPEKMFLQTSQCKSQLLQILQSLAKNHEKTGKEVANRLFMKKHKIVNMFIENVFDDNLNFLIHDCLKTNQSILEFFNKFNNLSNFSIKISQSSNQQTIAKIPIAHNNTTRNKAKSSYQNKKQFQLCRNLQRKTHKLSIPHTPQQQQSTLFPQTIRTQPRNINLSKEQQIQILKSSHLIQISKYHQTIQSLNAKLLILSKQNNIQQLCNTYQKQIMLLQLKIQELRKDISIICNQNKDQLKNIIKRQNQQLKAIEKRQNLSLKINPKLSLNQTKYKQIQKKLKQSQQTRKYILQQLKNANTRIQTRQKQISSLHTKLQQTIFPTHQQSISLSISSQKQLSQLNNLLIQLNNGNGQSYIFIKNKIHYLFKNLHDTKQLIIQSSQFLVQLQRMLQQKISVLNTTAVLDCNRFIRSFLLKIVQIKQ